MASLFTKIMDGQIPAEIIWTDESCVAFLDIEPLVPGHALVVPRQEIDHWIDLGTELTSHLMQVAARIGRAQQEVYGSDRVGVIIQGFEVPHAHIHVFPTDQASDFDAAGRSKRVPEDLASDGESLRAVLGSDT